MLGIDIIDQIMIEQDCTYDEAYDIFAKMYGQYNEVAKMWVADPYVTYPITP